VLRQYLSRFPAPAHVRLFPSYEEASRQVESGEADFVLVAAAFPDLNRLIFGTPRRLRIVDAFVADTPELVVATRGSSSTVPATIACAAAPLPSVRDMFPQAAILPAESNAHAARIVASGGADAALTTAPAAALLELQPLMSFGTVPMAWVILARDPASLTRPREQTASATPR
jgi:prephenate dehydratase